MTPPPPIKPQAAFSHSGPIVRSGKRMGVALEVLVRLARPWLASCLVHLHGCTWVHITEQRVGSASDHNAMQVPRVHGHGHTPTPQHVDDCEPKPMRPEAPLTMQDLSRAAASTSVGGTDWRHRTGGEPDEGQDRPALEGGVVCVGGSDSV